MRLTRRMRSVVVVTAIGLPTGLLIAFYSIFLASGVLSMAPNALKSLVDADAALLGFLGIITVFSLTSYNDSARLTEEQMYRVELERQKKIQDDKGIGYSNVDTPYETAEADYKLYKNRVKKLEKRLENLRANSKWACTWCFSSAVSFLTSILLSLLGMGEIGILWNFISIYFASCTCVLGVVFIFFMIDDLRDPGELVGISAVIY